MTDRPTIVCPNCKTRYKAPAEPSHEFGTCKKCGAKIPIPRRDPMIGRIIGGHRILSKIAEGGMGTVYLAEQISLHRKVAFKALKGQFAQDPAARQQFKEEAISAARISHANIVQVFDISEEDGILFITMELVNGVSLRQLMKSQGVLSTSEAIGIAKQVLTALSRAHRENVIHRDVKPENILIDRDGVVKVADFGLAKILEAGVGAADPLRRGTPFYISPEHARGEPVDHRTDIYSAGATLYHMVTGQTPYDASSPREALQKVISEDCPTASERNPDVPEALSRVIAKMMARSPKDRYASADDALKDLLAVEAELRNEGFFMDSFTGDQWQTAYTEAAAADAFDWRSVLESKRSSFSSRVFMAIVGAAVLAGIIGVAIIATRPAQRPAQPTPSTPPPPDAGAALMARLEEMYRYAETFANANPREYDRAINNFEAVKKAGPDTKYAMMAENQIHAIRKRRLEEALEVFGKLKAEADALAKQDRFGKAIETVQKMPEHLQITDIELKMRNAQEDYEAAAKARFEALTNEALEAMKKGDFARARANFERLRLFGMEHAEAEAKRGLAALSKAEAEREKRAAIKARVEFYTIVSSMTEAASKRNYQKALAICDEAIGKPENKAIADKLREERMDIEAALEVVNHALKAKPGQKCSIRGIAGELVRVEGRILTIRVGPADGGKEYAEPIENLSEKDIVRLAESAWGDLSSADAPKKLGIFLMFEGEYRDAERELRIAEQRGADVSRQLARLELLRKGWQNAGFEEKAEWAIFRLREAVAHGDWETAEALHHEIQERFAATATVGAARAELAELQRKISMHQNPKGTAPTPQDGPKGRPSQPRVNPNRYRDKPR